MVHLTMTQNIIVIQYLSPIWRTHKQTHGFPEQTFKGVYLMSSKRLTISKLTTEEQHNLWSDNFGNR